MARPVKGRGGQDQNGGVDEEREHQGPGRIDGGIFDGFPPAFQVGFIAARLHDGGVKVEVVRHDGGAQDADAHVEHLLVPQDLAGRHHPQQHRRQTRLGKQQLEGKTGGNGNDQGDDQRFDIPESLGLKIEHRQHIQRGDDAPPDHRDAQQQLQADGRPDHLGQVARGDGDLTQNPEKPNGWS